MPADAPSRRQRKEKFRILKMTNDEDRAFDWEAYKMSLREKFLFHEDTDLETMPTKRAYKRKAEQLVQMAERAEDKESTADQYRGAAENYAKIEDYRNAAKYFELASKSYASKKGFKKNSIRYHEIASSYRHQAAKERVTGIRGLLRKIFLISGICFGITGIAISSRGITGNTISNLTNNSTSTLGILLLIVGILIAVLSSRK